MEQDFLIIFYIYASVSFIVHLFSTWLNFRQMKIYQSTKFTDEIKQLFEVEESKFNESKQYIIEKMWFSFVFDWIEYLFKMNLIYYRWHEVTFEWVKTTVPMPFYFQVATVTILITLFNFFVLGLFRSWYATFVIEQKYEFNNTTYFTFLTDIIKGILISNLIVFLFVPAIFYTIDYLELKLIFIWLFVITTAFQILMTFIYPIIIEPLFNKLKPLEKSELRDKIIDLATSVNFTSNASPTLSQKEQIFTIDSSRRSNHSNVYVTGLFGKKRIVIYDTMLNKEKQNFSDDEILSIIAHELGHWVNNDIYYQFLISLFFGLFESILQQYYLSDAIHKIIISSRFSMLSALLLSPFSIIKPLFCNWFSRRCETQADFFSCQLGFNVHLQSALTLLNKQNKQLLTNNDWLFSIFHHSHPTLTERLNFLKSLKKYE